MSQMPPDWKDDAKLWQAMDTPTPKTSSNFNYVVRQRIRELAKQKQKSQRNLIFTNLLHFFKSWTGGVALATACLVIGLVMWQSPNTSNNPQEVFSPLNNKSEPVELAYLAQNLDIIQDMDVIEHLDELLTSP
jgi:hypothetical protein